MWDMPTLNDSGGYQQSFKHEQVPSTKVLFETAPYSLEDARSAPDASTAVDIIEEKKSRVFGRALSSAKPGEEFDVLLSRYMA